MVATMDPGTVGPVASGPGAEALEQVFEPFFRAGSELTRRQTGTGIGLSLVRDLVKRMGGHVRARNTSPGFEVHITLPAA